MYILGFNAYYGDSFACLIKDGKLVVALEEERIRRIKHWAGFPSEAVKFCLDYAGIGIEDINGIAVSRNPRAHLGSKIIYTLKTRPKVSFVFNRVRNLYIMKLLIRKGYLLKKKLRKIKKRLNYGKILEKINVNVIDSIYQVISLIF